MTPGQYDLIDKLIKLSGGLKVTRQYLENSNIIGGWENAKKGQANDIINILLDLKESLEAEKSGGD